jgi:hypothetical protein
MTLPPPRLLLSVFAKAEHFGVIADTPFGIGYQLEQLKVCVSFFGHSVYFCAGSAVLLLTDEQRPQLTSGEASAQQALLQLLVQLDSKYALWPPRLQTYAAKPDDTDSGR